MSTPGLVPAPPPAPPPSIPPLIPVVTPQPGGRLEQLLGLRDAARAAAEEAASQAAAIEEGIKFELAACYPGAAVIDLAGSENRPPLRLRWRPGDWYVPAKALRDGYPGVWKELAAQKRGYWKLHELDPGDRP